MAIKYVKVKRLISVGRNPGEKSIARSEGKAIRVIDKRKI